MNNGSGTAQTLCLPQASVDAPPIVTITADGMHGTQIPEGAVEGAGPKHNYWLMAAVLGSILLSFAAWVLAPTATASSEPGENTWAAVANTMNGILDESFVVFESGDLEAARDLVNDAYYSYYEAKGFEKIVMAYVSGAAATSAEFEFGLIKTMILAGGSSEEVKTHIETLQTMLSSQASQLDGPSATDLKLFLDSLIIILREGVEAILVLGAVITYLVKAGQREKLPTIYAGAGFAVSASLLLAAAIGAITALAGASQEVIEGFTILLACAMLIWVSSWIAEKADAKTWKRYIQTKTDASIAHGSVLSLAFVAFLAVFREGAEVVLLFQVLSVQAADRGIMLLAGACVGAVALVAIYIAIRYLSVRLPLRPFFLATSVILAVMAVSFAGSGISELQEGDVMSITPVSFVPTIDWLGIHPTAESLAAQGFALILLIGIALFSLRKNHAEQVAPAADIDLVHSQNKQQETQGEETE